MRSTVLGTVFLVWVNIGWCGAPLPEAVQRSQRAAVQTYPELGIAHSPLNDLFTSSYLTYQYNNPAYFKDDQWPILLAKECVEELARRKREQAETEARAQREQPALEARMRAYDNFPVPEPAQTPFDSDPQQKEKYLAAYQRGYRFFLGTGKRMIVIICAKGRPPADPDKEGLDAGIAAACHDHPECIIKSGASYQTSQLSTGSGG